MNLSLPLRRALIGAGLAGAGVLSVAPGALASSAPPSLAFTPSSWTAGPVAAGTATSQTFTITNTGGKASGALKVTLSGAAAFAATADSCTGRSLGPGKSCSVTVRYAPASPGEDDTASLAATGTQASATTTLTGSSISPSPFPQSQADCAAIGGTFSTDPSTDHVQANTGFLWSCNNTTSDPLASGGFTPIAEDCFADGGTVFQGGGRTPPFYSTCYKTT